LSKWIMRTAKCSMERRLEGAVKTTEEILSWIDILPDIIRYRDELKDQPLAKLLTPFGIEATYGSLRPVSLGSWISGVFDTCELVVSFPDDQYFVLQLSLQSEDRYKGVFWSHKLKRVIIEDWMTLTLDPILLERVALKLRSMNAESPLLDDATQRKYWSHLQDTIEIFDLVDFAELKRDNPSLKRIPGLNRFDD
jgi:hypothetical protein